MRRGDSIKVLGDLSVNEVYPFLFEIVKKGISDNNPYVRMVSLISLYKVSL